MATKLWNQEIGKSVDWGGDASTDYAKVSGKYVQKFIKDQLNSKFGYMAYDSTSLEYLIFADYEDYQLYRNDPQGNSDLILGHFTAPAPRSISLETLEGEKQSVTILSSEKNQYLSFKYLITDSKGIPAQESVVCKITFNSNGTTRTYVETFEADITDGWKEGTIKKILIDNYLTVGTNNITVLLTTTSSKASATLSFKYTVIELTLSSDFNNTNVVKVDNTLENIITGNVLQIPFKISGQGEKFMAWKINGEDLDQRWVNSLGYDAHSNNFMVTKEENYSSFMFIYLMDRNGNLVSPFKLGKNTVQFYTYIINDDRTIASKTLYFEFVIDDANIASNNTYILYATELDAGKTFEPGDIVEFSSMQYSSAEFDYSVVTTGANNSAIDLTFTLVKRAENDNEFDKAITDPLHRSILSGERQTFQYTFLTYGTIDIVVTTDLMDMNNKPLDTLHVVINVEKAAYEINVLDDFTRVLNFEALNRSNSEPSNLVNIWEGKEGVRATFDRVLWNSTSGWDGKALVLNSGATVSIPYNIFSEYKDLGATFEIDFEVINVKNEEAEILSLVNANNPKNASIKFTASEARITDGAENSVYTKFNSNERIKLAIIMNPYKSNWDNNEWNANADKNTMYIVVNGILDKCNATNGEFNWPNPTGAKLVIGNPNGDAGIKVHSIRLYSKALSLDEELTNFIAESSDILTTFDKNNVYSESTSSVSLDILKNRIPTIVVYGDLDEFNKFTEKKWNSQFDMEFYDPTDKNRDFFARSIYMCNQGTSSLKYPIRNMRPYFNKTRDTEADINKNTTRDKTAEYYTEVYLAGEFEHGKMHGAEAVENSGNFYVNPKTCSSHYHKLYNKDQAIKLQRNGNQLFYLDVDTNEYLPCSIDAEGKCDINTVKTWYVSAYMPIKGYNGDSTAEERDNYWKVLRDLRLSGWKLYKRTGSKSVSNPLNTYDVYQYSSVKPETILDPNEQYYTDTAFWKQYDKSGYTNVWTFKTDFAESSMCNNAGTGRLWNDCMANVLAGGRYVGKTKAQAFMENIKNTNGNSIDIRTACDGKPIVLFNCALEYDEAGNPKVDEYGYRVYSKEAKFVGLYNIMTDKASTNLFGFEDIYDEGDATIGQVKHFSAAEVECWECLTNAGSFSQGLSVRSDDPNNSNAKDRPIWKEYEARWPDVAENAHTHNLESLWRFINFCKPAVKYTIGDVDGYNLSPYIAITPDQFKEYFDRGETLYTGQEVAGNMQYDELSDVTLEDLAGYGVLYYKSNEYNYDDVKKELSGLRITGDVYTGRVPGYDATYGTFNKDIQFDKERVENVLNDIKYGDTIANSAVEEDYYIKAYLTRAAGSKFEYVDSWGKTQSFAGTPDTELDKNGDSFNGKTYMEYFSEKKYEYFDVERLALYYIYLMRFAAVDQVVKNSMLTTEDGQHYYYINYDNDTILGVRNDGVMIYPWNIDRKTYDYSLNTFCFAGDKSVLWNLLEMDDDFMEIVKTMDDAMYTSKVLSRDIALNMYNVLQQGTWSERLYNVQEEIKYLAQWQKGQGKDKTYLAFIHGAANQYRTWFINNRFDLYDSLWKSGEYMTTKTTFYMAIEGSDTNPLPMFDLTAAKQSLFLLRNSDYKNGDPEEWVKEINADETVLFVDKKPIKGVSSPWSLFGSDKIKALDFSKSIGVGTLTSISFSADSDWLDTKGPLINKLIFGNSDKFINLNSAYEYENISETETWQINNTIVGPGEFYYSANQVNGTLPEFIRNNGVFNKTTSALNSIDGIEKLTSLEELDIRNVYPTGDIDNIRSLDISTLTNLHVFRAIGSTLNSFKPATGCIFNEVSLPKNRINEINLNNVLFTPAEGQEAPVLKYTPDTTLNTVRFKNVSGEINGVEANEYIFNLLNNWFEICRNAGIEEKNLNISLEGIKFDFTRVDVQWVLDIQKYNIDGFTGKISIKGSGNNGALTQEEYDAVVEMYGNNVFNSSSALVFDAPAGFFWTVRNAEKINEKPETSENTPYYFNGYHDSEIIIAGNKFPAEPNDKIHFRFSVWTYNNNGRWVVDQVFSSNDMVESKYPASSTNPIMTLKNNNNGTFTFYSNISNAGNNVDKYVNIMAYNNDNSVGSNVFIKLNKVVIPSKVVPELPEGLEIVSQGTDPNIKNILNIDSNNEFDIMLKFAEEDVNVKIKKVIISDKTITSDMVSTVIDRKDIGLLINCYDDKDDANVKRLNVKPSINKNDVSCPVNIRFIFDTNLSTNYVEYAFELNVKTVYAEKYTLDASQFNDITFEDNKLIINKSMVDYKIPIIPVGECNVGIYDAKCILPDNFYGDGIISSLDVINENNNFFLYIKLSAPQNNDGYSFHFEYPININVTPGFINDTTINNGLSWSANTNEVKTINFDFDSYLIYPNGIKLLVDDNNISDTNMIINASTVGNSKLFNINVIPYNTNLDMHNITCDYGFNNITVEEYVYNGDNELVLKENHNQGNNVPKIEVEINKNDGTIDLTMWKWNSGDNENPNYIDTISEAVIKVNIDYWYTNGSGNRVNKQITVNSKTIWTVSVCSSIEDAVHYGDNEMEWYFVDVNNEYYQITDSTVDALATANKLNTIIGLAKQYSSDVDDIIRNNWDDAKSGATVYKPFCIPLAAYKRNNESGFMQTSMRNVAKGTDTLIDKLNDNWYYPNINTHNGIPSLLVTLLALQLHKNDNIGWKYTVSGDNKRIFTNAIDSRYISRALCGKDWSMGENYVGHNIFVDSYSFTENELLKTSDLNNTEANNKSALALAYRHFDIYKQSIVNDVDHEETNIKCYLANAYEIFDLFGLTPTSSSAVTADLEDNVPKGLLDIREALEENLSYNFDLIYSNSFLKQLIDLFERKSFDDFNTNDTLFTGGYNLQNTEVDANGRLNNSNGYASCIKLNNFSLITNRTITTAESYIDGNSNDLGHYIPMLDIK